MPPLHMNIIVPGSFGLIRLTGIIIIRLNTAGAITRATDFQQKWLENGCNAQRIPVSNSMVTST